MRVSFTLLDGGVASSVDAVVEGSRVLVSDADVARATGWERKPEGLCRDGMCVPLRDTSVHMSDRLELSAFASALRRPLALDVDAGVAVLGASAGDRSAALGSLRAPDFALPDLTGRMHTLGAQRGKKVLLVVYASW